MNNAKLQLEVDTPTSIKCGHIEWFALDTKLVGKVKALLEENRILKDNSYHNDEVVDKVNWENRLLKNRIDKAIEYISHEWFKREQIGISELSFSYTELQHILDILRGEDNE